MRTPISHPESDPNQASRGILFEMTPSHSLLDHTRLMIRWPPDLTGQTHQVTLPPQDLRMNLRSTGPHGELPRAFQVAEVRTISAIETCTLRDLVPMIHSVARWVLARGLAAGCIPPLTILSSGGLAEVVGMTLVHRLERDMILLDQVNRPRVAIKDRLVEGRAEVGDSAGLEVGLAAALSRLPT